MRKVTIGEILDKRADDMGVERTKMVHQMKWLEVVT